MKMLAWLAENWGNIVILGVLALVIGLIVYFRIRAKSQGKSTCSCGCSECAMKGICHSNDEKKKQ